MTPAEAFAVIPLAAVCADHRLQSEEAELLKSQLRGRSPYRELPAEDFGALVSDLLLGLRNQRQSMVEQAAALLSPSQQEQAFAFAARLVYADRIATPEETSLLAELRQVLEVPSERLRQIETSIALLSQPES
jgi:hypothetical protein